MRDAALVAGNGGSPGSRSWRTRPRRGLVAIGVIAILVASVAGVLHPLTGTTGIPGPSELVAAQTPPSNLDCATVNAPGITLTLDYGNSGLGGSQVELTANGFDNGGSITINMATEGGGEVSSILGSIFAGASEPAEITVDTPLNYYGPPLEPYAAGQYYFWAEDENSNCASSSSFNLTAVPPSGLNCGSYSGALTVSPDSGAAGSTVELTTTTLYPIGSTGIYWSTLSGSSYTEVASVTSSDPSATGPYVPGGYEGGNYVYWAVDPVSQCSGAGFDLTSSSISPTINIAPQQGPSGGDYTVSGSGFSPSGDVTVEFAGALQDPVACADGDFSFSGSTITADGSGEFECEFQTPTESAGPYPILATDVTTGIGAPPQSFNVTVPSVAPFPSSGLPSSIYTLSGTGFTESAPVSFGAEPSGGASSAPNYPLSCLVGTWPTYLGSGVAEITSSPTGTFNCEFAAPDLPPGTQLSLEAYDDVSGAVASSEFQIVAPSITVWPVEAPTGELFTVTGAGFTVESSEAETGLDLYFGGDQLVPVGGSDCTFDGVLIDADASGGFVCSFSVPTGIPPSTYSVIAADVNSEDESNSVSFTVPVVPTLTIVSSPSSGPVGTSLTVTGEDWNPNDLVELGVGPAEMGLAVTPIPMACGTPALTVSPDGTFSCGFDFPAGNWPIGSYDVYATDVSSVQNPPEIVASTDSFTLTDGTNVPTPTVALSPSAAPVGGTFTVIGSSFSISPSLVTINFEGQSLVPSGGSDCTYTGISITADSTGDFSCTFTVPTFAQPGANVLQAFDELSGQSDTLTFTVPELTTDIASAPPGSVIVINGTAPGLLDPIDDPAALEYGVELFSAGNPLQLAGSTVCSQVGPWPPTPISCWFYLPQLAPGSYSLVLTDLDTGAYGVAATGFLVTNPTVSFGGKLSPGTPAPLTATGLAPSTTYQIYFGNAGFNVPLASITFTTDPTGAVDTSVTIPLSEYLAEGDVYQVYVYQDVPAPAPSYWQVYLLTTSTNLVVIPGIYVSPSQGPEGTLFTVTGGGMTGTLPLTVDWDATPLVPQSCSVGTFSGSTITTDEYAAGFVCTFQVPKHASPGTAGLQAYGIPDGGPFTTVEFFEVTSPTVLLIPGQGPVGSPVTASGMGFSISSLLGSLVFDGQTITSCALGGSLASTAMGSFQCSFTVPSGTVGKKVVATDLYGARAVGTFEVTVPKISVAPHQGPIGAAVTVVGTGFPSYELVTLAFNGVTISACGLGGSLGANLIGGWSCGFVVPPGTSGKSVTAESAVGPVALSKFTVTTPKITLSAKHGPVGASITVTGSGFSVSSPLESLDFDGVEITTCTVGSLLTSASGTFSCTLLVPPGTSGTTVAATDAGGQIALAEFTVTTKF